MSVVPYPSNASPSLNSPLFLPRVAHRPPLYPHHAHALEHWPRCALGGGVGPLLHSPEQCCSCPRCWGRLMHGRRVYHINASECFLQGPRRAAQEVQLVLGMDHKVCAWDANGRPTSAILRRAGSGLETVAFAHAGLGSATEREGEWGVRPNEGELSEGAGATLGRFTLFEQLDGRK